MMAQGDAVFPFVGSARWEHGLIGIGPLLSVCSAWQPVSTIVTCPAE
jgi:hypothetical protein